VSDSTATTHGAIVRERLLNQQLVDSASRSAPDVVSRLGAVQAQDYAAAKWALAQRAPGLRDADIDADIDAGRLVRTHVLRPTWHFVAPGDVRWMVALSAPRIRRTLNTYFRNVGLDPRICARSRTVIERALRGGSAMTRAELAARLQRAHVPADGLRAAFLMIDAEIEGLIGSGPRRGRHATYALLDERVPPAPVIARDEALARLADLYFTSHGPAAVRDFAWWSGLTMSDARAGVEMNAASLIASTVAGRTYWSRHPDARRHPPVRRAGLKTDDERGSGLARQARRPPHVHLLPNFDEFLVGYHDRQPIVDGIAPQLRLTRSELLGYLAMVDGLVAGTWTRQAGGEEVVVEIATTASLARRVAPAMRRAAAAYGTFLERRVRCAIRTRT
jgi:hypothetical protein